MTEKQSRFHYAELAGFEVLTISPQDLAKYQSQTLAANSLSGKEENEVVISFDSAPGVSSTTSRFISDR